MKKVYLFYSLILLMAVLIIWELATLSSQMEFLFASPSSIIMSISKNIDTLIYDTLVTGLEALAGFFIGIILGTLSGFVLWYSPKLARIFSPYIFVIGVLPIFAFAPIIIIWFGIGLVMKIAMAAFGTFLISLTQAYEGAKSVDLEEFRLLRLFGASRKQILAKVIFPSSISWVLTSMKLNIGFALLGAFIGEFISANHGLGHFMLLSGSFFDIPSVFAGGLFLIVLAILFNFIVILINKNKTLIVQFFSVSKEVRNII